MITNFLDMRKPRNPASYLVITFILAAITYAATHGIIRALAFNPHFTALSIFLSILVGGLCYAIFLTQTVRRINDFHGIPILGLLTLFPAATVVALLVYGPVQIFSGAIIIIPILGFITLAYFMRPGRA